MVRLRRQTERRPKEEDVSDVERRDIISETVQTKVQGKIQNPLVGVEERRRREHRGPGGADLLPNTRNIIVLTIRMPQIDIVLRGHVLLSSSHLIQTE